MIERPFEQQPIRVGDALVTYGDLRESAHAMLHSSTANGVEKGLAAAVLALVDEVEKKS